VAHYDLKIVNGRVVDGTGAPPYSADLGISIGRIVTIGKLGASSADETIDAGGRYVGPGFIDVHTHYDVQIFRDPGLSEALQNGTTAVAMGNCGISIAPCRPEGQERCMLMLEATEQIPLAVQRDSLPWGWETFPEFMEVLRRTKKSLNLMMYAPLATIQVYVMGVEATKQRDATRAELDEMKRLVSEAMDAGAAGLSLCFMKEANNHFDYDGTPLPTDLMPIEHIVEVASVLRERGDGVIQCLTGRAGFDPTVELSERLAREVGRPILHNFLPAGHEGGKNGLAWHQRMNDEGHQVYSQAFNGRFWGEISLITAVCHDANPVWRRLSNGEGDNSAALALLRDPAFRVEMRQTYDRVAFDQTNGALEQMSFVQTGKAKDWEPWLDKTLSTIATERGMNIVDVYADINLASEGEAVFKTSPVSVDLEVVKRQLAHERIILSGSDGGAHIKAIANGVWPTDLMIWLVREEKILSVERAHHLMSYLPSRAMGLRDRGAVLEGQAADLVIYDLDELYFDMSRMWHSYDLPQGDWRKRSKAGGYYRVLVNGVTVYDRDEYTGADAGQVISPSPVTRT
jgi:N-acyl-D-aspartate/D-glutamate deacylase